MRLTTAGSLCLLGIASVPAIAQQPSTEYEVTVTNGPERAVSVRATLTPTRGILTMDAGIVTGDLPRGFAGFVKDLTIRSEAGVSIPFESPENAATWRIDSSITGPVQMEYSIDLSHDDHPWPFGLDEAAYENEDGLFFVGAALLIRTPRMGESRVKFVVPEGWHVSTPWERVNGDPFEFRVLNESDIERSCLMMGTHIERSIQCDTTTVTLALGGAIKENADSYDKLIDSCLRTYREFFDAGAATSQFLIVVNPGLYGAGAYPSSISILTPGGVDPRTGAVTPQTVHLFAHELLHLWNGQTLKSTAEWFKEGVTDYYTWLLLRRAGVIDDRKLLIEMGVHAGLYLTQAREVPIAESGRNKRKYYDLVYSGGAMTALAMDVQIRRESQGAHSLDDVMRRLMAAYGQPGKGFGTAELVSAAKESTEVDVSGTVERYVIGKESIPIVELFEEVGIAADVREGAERKTVRLKVKDPISETQRGAYDAWTRDEGGAQ